MSATSERSEAARLLSGIEQGTLQAQDAFQIAENIDPLVIYFIFRYLREIYPPGHQDAAGIAARMVELTSAHPGLVAKAKEGEGDPIREWFDDTYSVGEYRDNAQGFVDVLYDKIDG